MWAMEQLDNANARIFGRGRGPLDILNDNPLLQRLYSDINLKEYRQQSTNDIYRKLMTYYVHLGEEALVLGDFHHAIFCQRKSETFATAIARGVTVKELEDDMHFMNDLDIRYGDYNPFLFRTDADSLGTDLDNNE